MEVKNIFRTLLVLSFALSIMAVIYPHLGLHEMSEDLGIILMWNGYGGLFPFHEGDEWRAAAIVGLIIVMLLLIVLVVGFVGSFFYKSWGRTSLAISTFFIILINPIWGLVVTLPIEMLLYEVSGAAFYIALTMSFLPPLKQEFESKPNQQRNTDSGANAPPPVR